MNLASKSFLGFLIDPLGRHPRSLTLQGKGIAVRGAGPSWIGFEDIATRPSVRKGFLSSSLSLDLGGGQNLTLPAVDASAARTFADAVATAWTHFNRAELAKEDATVRRILHKLEALKVPDAYPAACHVAPLVHDAADLSSRVLSKLNAEAVGDKVMSRIAPIMAFASDPNAVRDASIDAFVEAQLLRWKDFFDTVESMPLTPEQRLSVVVDEDATLVLAGAGSGKTSVITAKAAYLVKAGIRKPSELLLLAFAKDAATEMSERIEARCGVPVAARTFHALAYEIIGEVEGEKPPLAPTATDDKAFLSLMKEILRHIVATASEIAQTVIGWFAGFFDDFPTEWDFKTKHEWYAQIESRNLRTLQGETVNSFEELLIANWLFRNGIAYRVEDCSDKARTLKMGKRAEAFLKIFEAVFQEYQSRLGDRIDFEDMVNRATALVESGRYQSPFRHILVDEFQDISTGRAKLIQALKRQYSDAKVFAVGDDWQSIYRFAGSDIHIMRNFGAEFGGTYAGTTGVHRTVDLGRTFRSVDKIALAARRFVLRNPAQITKTVIPAGETDQPSIRIAWTRRGTGETALNDAVAALAATEGKGGGKPSILILGRYRFLRPDVVRLQRQNPGAIITFKTIHASKGLEADHVIILGVDNARMGFPSMIVDDPLLSLVSPEAEPYPNAEERRVMYVAVTRARRTVTILASEARPSVFVEELMNEPEFGVVVPLEAQKHTNTCPDCGGRLLHMAEKDGHDWYRCEHVKLCGSRIPACPACGIGLPVRSRSSSDMVCTDCGETQPACPSCEAGWLVERRGRYGAFLGCVRFPDCDGKAKLPKSV